MLYFSPAAAGLPACFLKDILILRVIHPQQDLNNLFSIFYEISRKKENRVELSQQPQTVEYISHVI